MIPRVTARVLRFLSVAALGGLLLASAATTPPSGDPEADSARPMRDEDVVRMMVAGRSAPEIISEIRSRRVRFDLSDDMLEELRRAGVPGQILQAMRERQEEMDRERKPADAEGSNEKRRMLGPAGGPRIRILFGDMEKGARPAPLRVPLEAPEHLAAAARSPTDPEARAVTAVAVFLACRAADHVPDHWRSLSPLGRDFLSIARHRMLAFSSGGEPVSRRNHPVQDRAKARFFQFVPPEELTAAPPPGTAHDLIVGLALEIGGRYLQVASAELPNVVLGRTDRVFRASIRPQPKRGPVAFDVEVREVTGLSESGVPSPSPAHQ